MTKTRIILYAASYLLFFAALVLGHNHQSNRLIGEGRVAKKPLLLIWLHVAGILLLGGMAALIHSQPGSLFTAVAAILSLLFLCISAYPATKYRSLSGTMYKGGVTTSHFLGVYFTARILFITAYEIWFRGFLLDDSIAAMGMGAAIVLNLILYTLLHSVNSWKEMLGCIPFGLLLCLLCIRFQSFVPAIVLHLALTLSYEVSAIHNLRLQSART